MITAICQRCGGWTLVCGDKTTSLAQDEVAKAIRHGDRIIETPNDQDGPDLGPPCPGRKTCEETPIPFDPGDPE